MENKADLKQVRNLLGVSTPSGGTWFIYVNLDTFKETKDLIKIINESTTCLFFMICSKYSTFKTIKTGIDKSKSVFDFYITYLAKSDLLYLYDTITTSDNKLSHELYTYVSKSYTGDIEAVIDLFLKLNSGVKIKSRKDISDICGIGGNSTESFIFSLLTPLSGSDKGLKRVMKNRLVAGIDLCNTLGVKRFYTYINKAITSFILIKQLLISGAIYKSIRNLPDTYDEKALSRYNKFLWKIRLIPMSDLLRIKQCLGDKSWTSEMDFLRFLYKYYNIEAKLLLQKGIE